MTASFTLVLDTTAPTLDVVAPASVTPPEDLVVTVAASEDLGLVSIALVDALGTLQHLGFERVDARTVRLVAPTSGMATGPARLFISAGDEVLNTTAVEVGTTIVRDEGFDVDLRIDRGFDVDLGIDRAFQTVVALDRAFDVDLTLGRS